MMCDTPFQYLCEVRDRVEIDVDIMIIYASDDPYILQSVYERWQRYHRRIVDDKVADFKLVVHRTEPVP